MNAVIKVPTDNYGKMIPEKLDELIEKSIKNDQIPFMVGCTAGKFNFRVILNRNFGKLSLFFFK